MPEDVEIAPEVEQPPITEEGQQPDQPGPTRKLYDQLNKGQLYTKSFEDFQKQFSTPEMIDKLYNNLNQGKLYTKTKDEFYDQFFQSSKPTPDHQISHTTLQDARHLQEASSQPVEPKITITDPQTGIPMEQDNTAGIAQQKAYGDQFDAKAKDLSIELQAEPDKIKKVLIDFPGESNESVIKERAQMLGDNPQKYEKLKAADENTQMLAKSDNGGNHVANQYNHLQGTPEDPIQDLRHLTNNIYEQREIILSTLTGEERTKALNNLEKNRASSYNVTNGELIDEYNNNEEIKGQINQIQFAGLKSLEAFDPQKYELYSSLIKKDENEKDFTLEQKIGLEKVKKELLDIGRRNTQNYLNEHQYDLDKAYKNAPPEQQQQIAEQFLHDKGIVDAIEEDTKKDATKFPYLKDLEFERQAKELVGTPDMGVVGYALNKFGRGIGSAGKSIVNSTTELAGTDRDIQEQRLERLGESAKESNKFYLPESYKSEGSPFIYQFDKPLQEEANKIKNDKSITDEIRNQKLIDLVKANQDQVHTISNTAKYGKSANLWSKATLYKNAGMIGDIGSIAIQQMGMQGAGLPKLIASIAPMYLSTQNDFYKEALEEGKPNPMAYANTHAAIMMAAGMINPDINIVKRSVGINTELGKTIAGISENTWKDIVSKNSTVINKIKNSIGGAAGEAAKMGLTYGAGTSIANDLANKGFFNSNLSGMEIADRAVQATKDITISSLGLLGLHAVTNFKTVSPEEKGRIWELGDNPKLANEKLDEDVKNGVISTQIADQKKQVIKNVSKLIQSVPTEDAKGKPLTDQQRSDYLYNLIIKNKADDIKGDLPEAQKAKLDALKSGIDIDNNAILDPKSERENLMQRKRELSADLEVGEDGKSNLTPLEKKTKEAELGEITQKLEDIDNPKSEKQRITVSTPNIVNVKIKGTKEDFIKNRQGKISESDAPELNDLVRTLPSKGKPGFDIEEGNTSIGTEAIPREQKPIKGYKHITYRDEQGKIKGVIEVSYFDDKTGELSEKPQSVKVVVDKDSRNKGIATNLFKYAEENGIQLEKIRGKATTESGAGLLYKYLKNKENATTIKSAGTLDVGQQAGNGETLGSGNTESEVPPGETTPKSESKGQEEVSDELPFGHNPVGISHQLQVERSAAELNVSPPERGEGITIQEAVQQGRDLIMHGTDPEQVYQDFKKDGKISADAMSVVRARYEELAKATNDAYDKYGENSPQAKKAFNEERDWYTQAVKPMQTEWHKIGMTQQGATDLDAGTVTGLRRAFQDKNGKDFTPAQLEVAKQVAAKVKELTSQVADLKNKLDKAIGENKNEPKKTTISEKTKQIADTFRKLKTKEFTFKDSHGNDIPIQKLGVGWNDLVELGAKAIEKTGKIADGILAIVEKVKDADWYKNLSDSDKKRFENELESHFKTAEATASKQIKSSADMAAHFAGKQDDVFTPEEAKSVWKYVKEKYMDHGVSFGDALSGTATDIGLNAKQVLAAIASPKGGREITIELFKKQYEQRKALNFAKRFVDTGNQSGAKKFFNKLPSLFFSLKTYGHGTVGNITHAGTNIFRPSVWKAYWPNVLKSFSLAYGKEANYEKAVTLLKSSPHFDNWLQAGLAADPHKAYDEYQVFGRKTQQTQVGKGLQWLQEAGTRGFTGLNFMRYDMAEMLYNRASDAERSDPALREHIAELVNHATGHSEVRVPKAIKIITFAPGLEISRWQRMFTDPAKAINTFANWNKRSPAEQAAAKIVARSTGEKIATYSALLAANAGLLAAMGSKQKVNLNDPTKSDWMRFKFGGKTLDVTGNALSPMRLMSGLVKEAYLSSFGNKKDLRTKPGDKDAQTIGQQARYKFSPIAGEVADIGTGTDALGNPLPWSNVPPFKGKHKMNWFEYVSQQAPIPIAAGIKASMESMEERGMTKPQINDVLNGLLLFGVEGFTGAKLNEDYSLKKK